MLVHVSDVGWALLGFAEICAKGNIPVIVIWFIKGSFHAFTNTENLNADFLKLFLMIVAGTVFTESQNNSIFLCN